MFFNRPDKNRKEKVKKKVKPKMHCCIENILRTFLLVEWTFIKFHLLACALSNNNPICITYTASSMATSACTPRRTSSSQICLCVRRSRLRIAQTQASLSTRLKRLGSSSECPIARIHFWYETSSSTSTCTPHRTSRTFFATKCSPKSRWWPITNWTCLNRSTSIIR